MQLGLYTVCTYIYLQTSVLGRYSYMIIGEVITTKAWKQIITINIINAKLSLWSDLLNETLRKGTHCLVAAYINALSLVLSTHQATQTSINWPVTARKDYRNRDQGKLGRCSVSNWMLIAQFVCVEKGFSIDMRRCKEYVSHGEGNAFYCCFKGYKMWYVIVCNAHQCR